MQDDNATMNCFYFLKVDPPPAASKPLIIGDFNKKEMENNKAGEN